ncbi:MAG: exosome complex protein Rrp42 [Candidatus Njordarchaeales archaeon]
MISELKREIITKLEKETIFSLLSEGKRIDERGLYDFRQINIIPSLIKKAEGSALVELGNTKILAGVKVSPARPFPDEPNKGIFVVNTEFAPVASPIFEPGPPPEYAIEVARVVDRAIRSAEMIKLDELVIIPGKLVWMINIDIYTLDDDGNLIDASMIGAVSALLTGSIPKVEIVDEEKEEIRIIKEETQPIPIQDIPVSFTFAKIGNYIVLDPSYIEENIMDSRLTIAVNQRNQICAVQKGEGGGFKLEDILLAKDVVIRKADEMRSIILDQLAKKPRGDKAWEEIKGE